MARAVVCLYKQRSGQRKRELIHEITYSDEPAIKPTIGWVRHLIRTHYSDFVISDDIILMSRFADGYAARRACEKNVEGFVWQFLEIRIVPHKKKKKTLLRA